MSAAVRSCQFYYGSPILLELRTHSYLRFVLEETKAQTLRIACARSLCKKGLNYILQATLVQTPRQKATWKGNDRGVQNGRRGGGWRGTTPAP
jgi:hypothetical protein